MALVANVVLVGLSLILGIRLLRQYATRPRPHTLWYAMGLLVTALAAVPELFFELTGTLPTLLWWIYWATGSTLVGFLAVGTAYLMSPRFGQIALVVVALLALWVAVATVLSAGSSPAELSSGIFHRAPNSTIKLPFVLQNILGSLVIIIGAAISYVRTRGVFAILIILGTLVFASGGSASGLLKYGQIFAFTQVLGIVLLYAGVTLSLGPVKKAAPSGVTASS